MELQSRVDWKDGMAFDAHIDDHTFVIDSAEEHGGRHLGPRPRPLLLVSLAGCAAMDVVSILGKMRVPFSRFSVSTDSTIADEHPRRFLTIHVRYELEGDELVPHKIRRAVQLTEEKYCGVWTTLAPTVQIDSEIVLNGERLEDEDEAET